MSQEIIWTALPAGRLRATGRLNVHVAPRLVTPPGGTETLDDFPDFHDWPATVDDIGFTVEFGSGPSFVAVQVPVARRSDLWAALFPLTSRVIPHAYPDLSLALVHGYPTLNVLGWLQGQYAKLALDSGLEWPDVETLTTDAFEQIAYGRRNEPTRDQLDAELDRRLEEERALAPSVPPDPKLDFLQLHRFHRPKGELLDEIPTPTLDFHRAVALLGQHPHLLELFGLVIPVDFELPADGIDTVRIVPDWSPGSPSPADLTPWTRCEIGDGVFRTAPRAVGPDIVEGMLPFHDTGRWGAVQVDVDGGALKALDFAASLQRALKHKTADTPGTYAVPSLRSAGIAVARHGRAVELHQALVASKQHDDDLPTGTTLTAEDVTRGYAVDVWTNVSLRWHSLTRRSGAYTIDPIEPLPHDDEHYVSRGVTSAADGSSDDLYAQETLFQWQGWSLAAPHPGDTIGLDTNDPVQPAPPNDPGDEFPLRAEFAAAAGTLPFLRFGWEYRLRARAVDLAGHRVDFGDPASDDFSRATPVLPYQRFEPIQSPPVLLHDPRTEGESLERVVIRSDYDTAPILTTSDRHLVPPKAAQRLAEHHGMFDELVPDGSGGTLLRLSKDVYVAAADREAKDFDASHPQKQEDPSDYDETFYFPVDEVDVPYLPDPLAHGVTARFLDDLTGHIEEMAFGPDPAWPVLRPVRLHLFHDGGGPTSHWDPDTREWSVGLDQADIVRVRVSCHFADLPALDLMGVWGWATDAGPVPDEKRDAARLGLNWLLTPFRTLTLVHAVRRPLATPEYEQLGVSRALGWTYGQLRDRLFTFSRKSTSRVDVIGEWQEPVDLGPGTGIPDQAAPFSRHVKEVAFSVAVQQGPEELPTVLDVSGKHEFGDTKHRVVTYTAEAVSRFTEYFAEHTDVVVPPAADPPTPVVLDASGLVPGSVAVSSLDGTTVYQAGTAYTVDHDAGTIAFLPGPVGEAPQPGDTVRVRYVARPVTRTTADPPGGNGPRVLSIPNSARPAAPSVRYVVPTFEWEREDVTVPPGRTSRRTGGGLRVYLDRPWWTSGEGELLGVLTWPAAELLTQPELPDDSVLKPFVTQWGVDPVYGSPGTPKNYPWLARFPRAVAADKFRTVPGGHVVNVAGHEVAYDPDRDLWFCDIDVDTGNAYTPFVRLALARYQPESLHDAHLSPVVLAEFIQLAPDRFLSVVFDTPDDKHVSVSLSGRSHSKTEVTFGPGIVRVTVEQRIPAIASDLGWKPVGQPTTLAVGTARARAGSFWSGTVALPGSRAAGTYRLVVEQFELLGSEDTKNPHSQNPFVPGKDERLVYVDIVDLS